MASFYDNSSLYKIPGMEVKSLVHQSIVDVELLFFLHLDIEVQPEIIEMLDKICLALKVDKAKVEYLIFDQAITLVEIQKQYQAKKLVVFGATSSDLNMNMTIHDYKVYPFNQFKLLMVNDIMDVYPNKQLKAKLWNSLQEMFK
ncbi:MAG: hypothetical protein ACI8V8_000884 [Chitinophagales bacterium]|jgi:hypothetical protein